MCVSRFGTLCQPCLSNADCVNELGSDACVDYGDMGAFCGAPCDSDADCPVAYGCSDAKTLREGLKWVRGIKKLPNTPSHLYQVVSDENGPGAPEGYLDLQAQQSTEMAAHSLMKLISK